MDAHRIDERPDLAHDLPELAGVEAVVVRPPDTGRPPFRLFRFMDVV